MADMPRLFEWATRLDSRVQFVRVKTNKLYFKFPSGGGLSQRQSSWPCSWQLPRSQGSSVGNNFARRYHQAHLVYDDNVALETTWAS